MNEGKCYGELEDVIVGRLSSVMVIPLDYFDLTLGIKFLVMVNVVVMSYLPRLMIMNELGHNFLQGVYKNRSQRVGK